MTLRVTAREGEGGLGQAVGVGDDLVAGDRPAARAWRAPPTRPTTELSPGEATTARGADGVPMSTPADGPDAGPAPMPFLATTTNVYVRPFVSPEITCFSAALLNVCAGWAAKPT